MTMNEVLELKGKLERLLDSESYEDRIFALDKMQELGNLTYINNNTSNIGDNDTANFYFKQLQREVNSRTSQKSNDDARDVWLALKYGVVR